MDFPRHAEKTIRSLASMFPAVLITGSRQVGKTTLFLQAIDQLLDKADHPIIVRFHRDFKLKFFNYFRPKRIPINTRPDT